MKILVVISNLDKNVQLLDFSRMFVEVPGVMLDLMVVLPSKQQHLHRKIEKFISYASHQIGEPGLNVKIRFGTMHTQVSQEVNLGNYDLVILRERSTSFLNRLLHRNPAVNLTETLPCSVIILIGLARPVEHILMCDSGGGKSALLNQFTAKLVQVLPGTDSVSVLHVMSQLSAGPGVPGKDLRASTEELIKEKTLEGLILESDIQTLENFGVKAVPKIRHGLVLDEILAETKSGHYDLLIIGAHTEEHPQTYLLENIARQIILKVNIPVLIVREKPAST
jgi:nucleotide-binding universal stress UspA family protein